PTLSLREAVALVDSVGLATDASGNSLASAKAGQISGSSFGTDDTIKFDPSLFFGSQQTVITLVSGELLLSKNVTITGPSASSLAISGNNSSRVFEIASGTTATLSGLNVEGGYAYNPNGNANLGGGGIKNYGNLWVE